MNIKRSALLCEFTPWDLYVEGYLFISTTTFSVKRALWLPSFACRGQATPTHLYERKQNQHHKTSPLSAECQFSSTGRFIYNLNLVFVKEHKNKSMVFSFQFYGILTPTELAVSAFSVHSTQAVWAIVLLSLGTGHKLPPPTHTQLHTQRMRNWPSSHYLCNLSSLKQLHCSW